MRTTTGNGAVLTAHEAIIQTASIEIQTLRVGKKQVTMGLFRQLPEDLLLDPETLQLRGVPWGHVNYFWDGDGRDTSQWYLELSGKLHVVWQLGETLRRAVVYGAPNHLAMERFDSCERRRIDDCTLLRLAQAQTCAFVLENPYQLRLDGKLYDVSHLSPAERQVLRTYCRYRNTPAEVTDECARAQASGNLDALLEARGLGGLTWSMVYEDLLAIRRECEDYKSRWAKQWQVLTALPQLFIAV